ncbi:MAG: hypothetical protein WCL18_10095 [bacterium]
MTENKARLTGLRIALSTPTNISGINLTLKDFTFSGTLAVNASPEEMQQYFSTGDNARALYHAM